jgi:hypothetical protein
LFRTSERQRQWQQHRQQQQHCLYTSDGRTNELMMARLHPSCVVCIRSAHGRCVGQLLLYVCLVIWWLLLLFLLLFVVLQWP